MIRTVFLNQEGEGVKRFNSFNVFDITKKRFDVSKRIKQAYDVSNKTRHINMFFFTDGSVELKNCNFIYCLEHIPYNTDMLLPKNPKLLDWVLLHYEQTTVADVVSFERVTKIKLRGNGQRIMGLDEPLNCDIPFMSLRLTFLGDIDGWVVT